MINETFLNHLKPVELEFIQAFIYKLTSDKITLDTTNSENIESTVSRCPHCGSFHFVKNGFNKKHRQKYLCRNCGKYSVIQQIPFFLIQEAIIIHGPPLLPANSIR